MNKDFLSLFAAIAVAGSLPAQASPNPPEKLADGIVVPVKDTFLKVEVYGDNVVRIACAKDRAFFARKSVMTEPKRAAKAGWSVKSENGETILSTTKLQVHVNLATGAVSFFDASGKPVLAETPDGRTITPAEVQGEQTFHVRQQWEPNADESLYGLGQRQIGIIDIKGYDLDLWQHNTHVVVPFLVSSRGYGVLWDNLSFTRFGDLREFEPIPANCLIDTYNQSGGLTTGVFTPANPGELEDSHATNEISIISKNRTHVWRRWVGEIVPPATGDYQFKTYSNGRIKMWLDGKVVIEHWRQGWLTENDQIKIRLEAGRRYAIKLEYGGDEATTMQLTWKTPDPDREHLPVVRGGGRRGLLLRLWSGTGSGRRRIPPTDGPGVVDAGVGVWLVAIAPALRNRPAKPRCGQRISPDAPFLSTTSCRTGNTGSATPGVPMSLTPIAFPTRLAGSRNCMRCMRTS